MKRKFITLLALAMLLALSLMCTTTALAGSANGTSHATIQFEEGDPEFVDGELGAGLNDMNINFGIRDLPTNAVVYNPVDGAHTLRVRDARLAAGDWAVTVSMGQFENQVTAGDNFDAVITLTGGTTTTTSVTQTNLVTASTVTLDSSTGASAQVLSVDAGYSRGDFDTTWAEDNIKLSLDQATALAVVHDEQYKATMTWTLTWA